MGKKKDLAGENRILEKTLDSLDLRREAPRSVFVIILLLYLVFSATVSLTAGSQKIVVFGGNPTSLYTFAGIFSSAANLCIILMVVFCGKPGFIASVSVLLIQIPMLLMGIIFKHNLTSLPGIFGNIMTVIVVIFIYRNNKKVESYQSRIREQATTDLLTGLPNGFASTELINELIRHNKAFAAVTIDINGFKNINDAMGFDMGNKVLVEVASRWKKIADEGLSGTLDFVTRINGDEFSLVIRGYDSDEDIVNTIKRYEEALNEKISIDGYDLLINASFGYAVFPSDSNDRDSLLTCSVAAMKETKRIGNSGHILRYSPELLKIQNLLLIDNKIRDALDNDRVYINLQPQYDMLHKLRGFEALARMKDDEGKIISPVEFIPAAERIGLIDTIDLTVYKKAASFLGDLVRKTGTDITLSINVSVKHLMKNDFIEEIKNLLKDSDIPASQLEIEITESIMIESAEKAASCLNELKAVGIKIAIDDFGTGFSSLSYLNSFPADILKIDKSFIDNMNTGESSKKYVEAIISMAHVLDFKVIAEGVEEEGQIDTLKRINCDFIQGFIWGRPLPEEEAERLVLQDGVTE